MDSSKLVKWVIILVIVFAGWKYGLPWIQSKTSRSSSSGTASTDNTCISIAGRASETWGSAIGKFVNPPYDMDAWSSLSASVNSSIVATSTACGCPEESCQKVQGAMRDLKTLVSDMDSAIRSGQSPGSDIVQRQSAIDDQLDAARELVRAGK
jgi:hypothetical protein